MMEKQNETTTESKSDEHAKIGTTNVAEAKIEDDAKKSAKTETDVEFLDRLIEQLRERHSTYSGAALTAPEIGRLIGLAKESFLLQRTLIDIEPPVTIVGDIHGQYNDLLHVLKICGWPPETRYLFLGDYVDRGPLSIEVVCLVFALKVRFPDDVYLLRGNHECRSINRSYGFYEECANRYSWPVWDLFQHAFAAMPICALVKRRIFCMHGGIPRFLRSFDELRKIKRPIEIPDKGLLCDLLWSDPLYSKNGWASSDRGAGYLFGKDVIEEFCNKFDIDLVVRAHQVVTNGYKFFANRRLVTVFSAPNYTGTYRNAAAMMLVDKNLLCRFKQMKRPVRRSTRSHSKKKKRPPKPKIVQEEVEEDSEDESSEEEEQEMQPTVQETSTKWVERALMLLDEMFKAAGFLEYHPGQPKLPKNWMKTVTSEGDAHLSYRRNEKDSPAVEISIAVRKGPEVSLHLKAHELINERSVPFECRMDAKPEYQTGNTDADNAMRMYLREHFLEKMIKVASTIQSSAGDSFVQRLAKKMFGM